MAEPLPFFGGMQDPKATSDSVKPDGRNQMRNADMTAGDGQLYIGWSLMLQMEGHVAEGLRPRS